MKPCIVGPGGMETGMGGGGGMLGLGADGGGIAYEFELLFSPSNEDCIDAGREIGELALIDPVD